MKFKLKALAVAASMLAASSAFAALPSTTTGGTGGTGNYTGGSDLIFFAWSAGNSYVQDLGVQAGSFLPSSATSSQTWSLLNASAYDSFVSASGSNSILWGVMAGRSDTGGGAITGLGQDWLETTVRLGTAQTLVAPGTTVDSKFKTLTENNLNNLLGAAPSNAYFSSTVTADNWATALKSNANTNLGFNTDNVVGASGVAFDLIDTPDGSGGTAHHTVASLYQGSFGFDGTTLSYTVAAVPEPSTYGMLIAGLLMVGAIARRRIGS